MKTSVYIGVDIGATSLTAVALDDDGQVLATQRRAGGNVFTAPGDIVFEEALRDSLVELREAVSEPVIAGLVLGVAGSLTRSGVDEPVTRALASAGVTTRALVVNDAEAIFASGSTSADGHCLAVGTGAIGVAIRDHQLKRTVDGHGWLLGDAGSAVWIALEAIRAILAALEGAGDGTALVAEVTRTLGDLTGTHCPEEPTRIVAAAHRVSVSGLAAIAPLVDAQAKQGDAVAARILDKAARALTITLSALIGGASGLPIVLGGSIAYANTRIRRHLERFVSDRWPDAPVEVVRGGAPGAAVWAMRNAGRPIDEPLLRIVREISNV